MGINEHLLQRKRVIDRVLLEYIPKGNKYTRSLYQAVKYSITSGGKRIRPILVLESCEAVSGSWKQAIPLAAAVEMAHTFTLIHDDLPAMDNDDYRRGKLACHKVFGEDMAILAGDMLNTLAFQLIADNYKNNASAIISDLAAALGMVGVMGGQAADLDCAIRKTTRDELKFISIHKTAALFAASVRCGAIAGGAGPKDLKCLSKYATHMGLAFQIIDDILDYDKESVNSYPAVFGMKNAKKESERELGLALSSLPSQNSYQRLKEIAVLLSKRKE